MSALPDHIERLNPEGVPDAAELGYTQVTTVTPGRLAFVSGQIARRAVGDPVPSGLAEQAAIIAADLLAVLDGLDATPEHIVMLRLYLVDLSPDRMAEALPSLAGVFGDRAPSVTAVGVTSLADPEFQLEVEMVVGLDD